MFPKPFAEIPEIHPKTKRPCARAKSRRALEISPHPQEPRHSLSGEAREMADWQSTACLSATIRKQNKFLSLQSPLPPTSLAKLMEACARAMSYPSREGLKARYYARPMPRFPT